MSGFSDYKENLKTPSLKFNKAEIDNSIGKAYRNAVHNLIDINTVPCDEKIYNRTGLISYPPGLMIRAGGDYETPWTRDASINSWNAASLIEPEVARNTLWAVCERLDDGRIVVQQDNQWWDKVIWVTGAWSYYITSGDEKFLVNAYHTSMESLKEMKASRYNECFGLFQGPSFFNDGIAGYPEPLKNEGNHSSFVLDHAGTDKIMALSTNCVYYNAYKCAALMAWRLGRPDSEAEALKAMAESLKYNINKYYWIESKNTYGYFIYGDGELKGRLNDYQEGMGLAFAILFGVADQVKAGKILDNVHMEPYGITDVWPHFERYSDSRPGRHNVTVWPLINGIWAHAAALGGRIDILEREINNIAKLVEMSDGEFFEIYDSKTGDVHGGWQCDISSNGERMWRSCSNQTWSATSFIRALFNGLFGMEFGLDGLRFWPGLPKGWGPVELNGVRYRNMELNIRLEGNGQLIEEFIVNGVSEKIPFIPSALSGVHNIVIKLK